MTPTAGAADAAAELLSVSWGGTGRAASVREAVRQAIDERRPLRYLAVLDDDHFADLDHAMIALLTEELQWLLDAQLELIKIQLGADDMHVAVTVGAGQVVDLVVDTVASTGATRVLIGAPVPVAGHDTIQSMVDQIADRTGCKVGLVVPPEWTGPT